MKPEGILNKLSPSRLFLIDSLGALLTALMTGGFLVHFEPLFGMPKNVLYVLASIASCFSIYSFICWCLVKKNWKPFLTGIALSNAIYAVSALVLAFYFHARLTPLGWIYFIGEAIIVAGLCFLEFRKVSRSNLPAG